MLSVPAEVTANCCSAVRGCFWSTEMPQMLHVRSMGWIGIPCSTAWATAAWAPCVTGPTCSDPTARCSTSEHPCPGSGQTDMNGNRSESAPAAAPLTRSCTARSEPPCATSARASLPASATPRRSPQPSLRPSMQGFKASRHTDSQGREPSTKRRRKKAICHAHAVHSSTDEKSASCSSAHPS
jgi:hypothetical protein